MQIHPDADRTLVWATRGLLAALKAQPLMLDDAQRQVLDDLYDAILDFYDAFLRVDSESA
jgi:hypothetical protein